MRRLLIGSALIVLASCSKAPDQASEASSAPADISGQAPGIAVTSAPGVAFNYRYTFSLPVDRVASTQEAHAQACERLGIARCRITGMQFHRSGENSIGAQLAFRLDPAIARAFGKSGIDAVVAADGVLTDAEITGTDAGAAIDRATIERNRAAEEITRIDRQLAALKASARDREELQRQRDEAAGRVNAATDEARGRRESLANTPMVFDYQSGPAIRGFDASAPVRSAIDMALGSAQATLAFVLGAMAILGPPGLVALAAWLLWRRFRGASRATRPAEATTDIAPSTD